MTDVIHILLVDDDIKNSMLLKKFLEVEEYRVTYANNGAVGWELANCSSRFNPAGYQYAGNEWL